MPKKKPITNSDIVRISQSVEQAAKHAIGVKFSLSNYFKANESIRVRWDAVVQEMQALRKATPQAMRDEQKSN